MKTLFHAATLVVLALTLVSCGTTGVVNVALFRGTRPVRTFRNSLRPPRPHQNSHRPLRPHQNSHRSLRPHQLKAYARDVRLTNHRNVAGLTVQNQTFGEAILEPNNVFEDTPISGIMGLGFPDIEEEEEPTVFDNMVSQGILPAPVFSFYLKRIEADGPDSVLTLGGTNSDFYTGEFTFVDISESDQWQFKMDRIQLFNGAGIIYPQGYGAVVDSGASLIIGPKDEVDHLNRELGGSPIPEFPRMFRLDCSTVPYLPDIEFVVKGRKLALSSKYYIVRMLLSEEEEPICMSGLIFNENWEEVKAPFWLLGNLFMRAFYTQFDKGNSRIGFAKTKY
ncbi:cathepsin d [Plakobranchus ocellatus]|uniref:Cathepsin d n=1 Tax=Plakobranchus ocellatus TaxID=259542 RepID=A0AAV4B7A2_9GAST|nr:cathepsin d [Plakobranchus ocellatus]